MSLSEIYLLEFNLMFPGQDSFIKIRDILAICLASLRPLTLQQIYMYVSSMKEIYEEENSKSSKGRKPPTGSNNYNMSWDEFVANFELLNLWLLPVRADKTVMFFHSTVKDWYVKLI